jgi:peptide/nickel transport system substrate-binding protein
MPCFIATAAYGSELSPAVQYLRNFRDSYVKATYVGSRGMEVFDACYYSFSPTIAGWVAGSLSARTAVKAFLYPLFGILEASAATYNTFSFSPELGITLAGILAASLIGLVYDTPLVIFAQYHVWRKWRFVLRLRHLKPLLYVWISSIIGIGLAEVFRWSVLMRVSTAALVLSSMAGSALLVSILLFRKISK